MDQILEKMLFLEMTREQYATFNEPDYLDTYARMNETQREEFHKLSAQIHRASDHINGPAILNVHDPKGVYNLEDYHDQIEQLARKILSVARDFNITLKKVTPKFFWDGNDLHLFL